MNTNYTPMSPIFQLHAEFMKNHPPTVGHIGWSPDYKSHAPELGNTHETVTRKAFICVHCECVYADDPVTQCDCLGELDKLGPHFIEGAITYPKI